MSNALLSVNETCRRLSIGRSTLYTRIANGEIGAIKVGSRTLISEDEIARFLEAGTREAEALLQRSRVTRRAS